MSVGYFFKRLFMKLVGLVFLLWGFLVVAIFFGMRADGELAGEHYGLVVALTVLIGGLPIVMGLVFLFKRAAKPNPQPRPRASQPAVGQLRQKFEAGLHAQMAPPAAPSAKNKTPQPKKVVDSQNYFE